MSIKIKQIFDVVHYIKSNWKGHDITRIRIDASKFVARKNGINERTVVDKYRRQLKDKYGNDLGTQKFDHLLEKWLSAGDQELKTILLQHCIDENDRQLVIKLFGNDEVESIGEPLPTYSPNTPIYAGSVPRSDDEKDLLDLVIEEIAPDGPKKFPNEFFGNEQISDFYEVDLPGTLLKIDPLFKTEIASSKGYFKYHARNPAEAKYILYSHNIGLKKVIIPKDNFVLFKAVKDYEKYCRELKKRAFEHFLEFTYDEQQADILTEKVIRKLELKAV
jgi:hypothetical protein